MTYTCCVPHLLGMTSTVWRLHSPPSGRNVDLHITGFCKHVQKPCRWDGNSAATEQAWLSPFALHAKGRRENDHTLSGGRSPHKANSSSLGTRLSKPLELNKSDNALTRIMFGLGTQNQRFLNSSPPLHVLLQLLFLRLQAFAPEASSFCRPSGLVRVTSTGILGT